MPQHPSQALQPHPPLSTLMREKQPENNKTKTKNKNTTFYLHKNILHQTPPVKKKQISKTKTPLIPKHKKEEMGHEKETQKR